MINGIRCLATITALAGSLQSAAAVIETLTVTRDGPDFVAEARFVVDLPHVTVFGAFTAFDRLSELNPAVIASKAETLGDGSVRVTTHLKDCWVVFCRSVAVVEDVSLDPVDGVRAVIVPELSDFASGYTTWQFADLGRQTRVHYQSRMTPKFWLPPLIGSKVLRQTLERQIRATANRLESIDPRASDEHGLSY